MCLYEKGFSTLLLDLIVRHPACAASTVMSRLLDTRLASLVQGPGVPADRRF